MTENSTEFIRQLEDAAGLRRGRLSRELLRQYRGLDISSVPENVEIELKKRFAQILVEQQRRRVSTTMRHRVPAMRRQRVSRQDLVYALRAFKGATLSMSDEVVSGDLKEFIKDHCVC